MYALNINKGTEIIHPEIGILESGVAVYIPDYLVPIAEHLKGVVVFQKVKGIVEDRKPTKDIPVGTEEDKLTYDDFVRKYKGFKQASEEWDKYKKQKGI
jgi:hypothetical protein